MPPSKPVAVITASPRTKSWPKRMARRLSGWPAKRDRKCADQSTLKPQLDGRNGVTNPGRQAVQPASAPSRGQEAPPSARIVALGCPRTAPSGVSNLRHPSRSHPDQRCRRRNRTPRSVSRRDQARSSGEAFIAAGNTRPLDPVKVGCPSPWHHAVNALGGNAAIIGSSRERAVP